MYNGVDMKRLLAEKGGCMSDLWENLVTRVKQLLEEGKAIGDFDASIPTKVMLLSFFSMFSPKVYDHMLLGDDISRADAINYLWHIYVNGIASPTPR